MSPEQVEGKKPDSRTDIFSFGVVLYELFCARRPFEGDTETAVFYDLVHTPPQPLARYCRNLPEGLERIVFKCLAKKPEERYQSAADLTADLKTLKRAGDIDLLPSYITTSSDKHKKARARRLKLMGAIAGLALIGAIAVLLFLRNNNKPIELNPNMTFRTLDIPFRQVEQPGLSPDGNWVSFSAADANGKWDLYFMNISGGEPRRITFDSTDFTGHSDLSPDGSWIIYDYDLDPQPAEKWEVRLVSSLGGAGLTVASPAARARWSPDGKRIGYLAGMGFRVPSQSGKLELRSVKPDGSDNRQEFADSLSDTVLASWFDWSPDGRSVAWVRLAERRKGDIFVRELKTGKERQLTFDKSEVNTISWSGGGQIVFSSNKSGNFDLWAVPASGGPAVQITKGDEDEMAPKISADGKKLIYRQLQPIGQIWIAKLDGSGARQVTPEGRQRWSPCFSPDGRQIAFVSPEPGNAAILRVYAVNRDGTSRRQMSFGNESAFNPRWSPDGKWMAYSSRLPAEPLDSSKAYLVEAANPGKPKLLGKGGSIRWLDSERLVAFAQARSWIVYTDGREAQPFFRDSTFAIPILKEKYILYIELPRAQTDGWWIVPSDKAKDSQKFAPKKVAPFNRRTFLAPDGDFFLFAKNEGEIWKVKLPEGTEERLPGVFPGVVSMQADFNISYDGKEVVYVDRRTAGKLVMIENLFK